MIGHKRKLWKPYKYVRIKHVNFEQPMDQGKINQE
jgi:hypothetical protein